MKAIDQCFRVMLFIMLYKVVLTLKSRRVYESLVCDYSNASYWLVLSCGTVYYAVKHGSNFWIKPQCVTIQMKAIEKYSQVVLLIMLYWEVLVSLREDDTLSCNNP